jgi:hypothetical protein
VAKSGDLTTRVDSSSLQRAHHYSTTLPHLAAISSAPRTVTGTKPTTSERAAKSSSLEVFWRAFSTPVGGGEEGRRHNTRYVVLILLPSPRCLI